MTFFAVFILFVRMCVCGGCLSLAHQNWLTQLMQRTQFTNTKAKNHKLLIRAMSSNYQNQNVEKNDLVKHSNIPDISLQLVFRFVCLKQLPNIVRCCKKWQRVVTDPIFLKMYKHDNIQYLFGKGLHSLCLSPFRHAIKNLDFSSNDLNDMKFISQCTQLNFIEIKIDFDNMKESETFDYLSTFLTFPQSLRVLKLDITFDEFEITSLASLLGAVSSLIQIEELTISCESDEWEEIDISILSTLINLKKLVINFQYDNDTISSIVSLVRSLPNLKQLESCYNLFTDEILPFLRQLCAQTDKPCLLEQIFTLENVCIQEQHECLQLLKQIPYLRELEYQCIGQNVIPPSLVPIIVNLYIEYHSFTDSDIDSIISMTQLTNLGISECCLTDTQFKRLFNGVGNQLKLLSIDEIVVEDRFVLLNTISKCSKLEDLKLEIEYKNHLEYAFYLPQLCNCKLLQALEISLQYYREWDLYVGERFQKSLQLLFPLLEINISNSVASM
jgi:hypothetical protein